MEESWGMDMEQLGLNEQIPPDIAVSPCPARRPAWGLVLHILDWDLSLPPVTQRSFFSARGRLENEIFLTQVNP